MPLWSAQHAEVTFTASLNLPLSWRVRRMSAVINAVTTAGEKSMGQSDGSLAGHCVV